MSMRFTNSCFFHVTPIFIAASWGHKKSYWHNLDQDSEMLRRGNVIKYTLWPL